MALFLPRRWRRQPPYRAGVLRGDGLATALALTEIWAPLAGLWLGPTHLRQYYPIRKGSDNTSQLKATPFGFGALFPNSDKSVLELNSNTDVLLGGSVTTVTIFVFRRNLDTTARGTTLFGYSSGTNRVLSHAPFSNGNIYWDFGNSTEGSGRISTAFTKTTTPETLVFCAGPTVGRQIWRNGILIASNASATATRSSYTNPFYIGALRDEDDITHADKAGVGDSQELYLFGVSNSEVTAPAIIEFCANPWQIFAPQRSVTYFLGTAEAPADLPTRPHVIFDAVHRASNW